LNQFRRLLDTHQTGFGRLRIDAGGILLLAVAYFLTARVSMQFSGMPGHISFVWLPAGLSLAALLVGGVRWAPSIALGAFVAQYSVGGDAWMCAVFALGSVLSAVVGTWLLRKLAFSRALDRPRDVLSLVAVGAFLSPIVAATFGATGAYWAHPEPSHDWSTLWAVWWAGDALGVLLLAPALLCWLGARPPPWWRYSSWLAATCSWFARAGAPISTSAWPC
jgi:integral membrane sensor domain MASE1